MSFIAKMQLDGEEMNVLHCSYRFIEGTDATGLPNAVPRGGAVKLVVESSVNNTLFEWMILPLQTKSGVITFFRRDALSTLKKLHFNDAYCVDYYETFDHQSNDPMQVQLVISATVLKMNESEYKSEGVGETGIEEANNLIIWDSGNLEEVKEDAVLQARMLQEDGEEEKEAELKPKPGRKLTSEDFYNDPQSIWGIPHEELKDLLLKEGWETKEYKGTSTAFEFILDSKAGRKSIVINYGGGRHTHDTGKQVFAVPFYYKITGGGITKTKVIDPKTYPIDDMAGETFKFVDGTTGDVLKD